MLLSTHTFAVCTRHTHPGPVITFPTPPLSTQTQRHINRLPRTYAGRHMQKCEYINADTYRNKRKCAGIYTRTNLQAERTEHIQTKKQCDTKTKIHSGRTYTPVQLRQLHISQSHISQSHFHTVQCSQLKKQIGLVCLLGLLSMFVCCASANGKLASWGSLSG